MNLYRILTRFAAFAGRGLYLEVDRLGRPLPVAGKPESFTGWGARCGRGHARELGGAPPTSRPDEGSGR
jgi:hypothetical protein